MFGLTHALDIDHANQLKDKAMIPYSRSVNRAKSKMIALTFYFE